jgi:hypothetical protein
MENHKAYSYLTSFVMLTVTKMFHSDALTAQELKGVVSQGFEGLDDLLTAYYRTYAIPYITVIRPQCSHAIPLITRQALTNWIIMHIISDAVNYSTFLDYIGEGRAPSD